MSASSSRRRYLSVWLRRLATDRIARCCSPAPADAPLVIVDEVKSALRLTALNDAAARLGLKTGMPLADARAMYPGIAIANADAQEDRRLLEAVADWCDRYTPLVGLDPPDGLLLDVTGCAHLFGGEATLCRDLVQRLEAQGFQTRVAVADTVGCAWGLARYGNMRVVPQAEARQFLSPLPLAALRIAPEVIDALAQSGLRRVTDVLDRPRAPLAARFDGLIQRLDQALGHDDEPITPRLPLPTYVAEQRFADPIALEHDVLGTIEHLAQELELVMERRGEGARLLQVALFRVDGKVHRIEVGTGAPLRDAARIRRLFTDRLAVVSDECDPGFGFDVVRLSALAAERCDPVQTGLAAPDHAAELSHLIDRLGARFGLRRVTRFVPQDTHIPEFAVASMPAHAVEFHRSPFTSPQGGEIDRAERGRVRGFGPPRFSNAGSPSLQFSPRWGEGDRPPQENLGPGRPIRLFEQPELIEAMAEVPEGPPVRFRWRRVLHEVAHVEGPERIAMEWWRDRNGQKLTRDYFRIESVAGMRAWLYREGLYGQGPERPRWFLHGLFA